MYRVVLLTFLMLMSCVSFATQKFDVKGADTIEASIDPNSLNRIYLEEDRIQTVKAVHGQFQIDKDEKSGDVYIKPDRNYQSSPIHLFITSEKGFTYSVALTPDMDTPQMIALHNSYAKSWVEKSEISKSSLPNEVYELLRVMHQEDPTEMIHRQTFEREKLQTIRKDVAVSHAENYWGTQYVGEVLYITNDSRSTVSLRESLLMDEDNVVAISILSKELPRHTYTKAYRVKTYE